MWMMTTKDRPKAAEKTLSACWQTCMKQPGIMYVDGTGEGYDSIAIPDNWEVVYHRDLGDFGNLAASKQYVFKRFPDERVYGWLADDIYPETEYWSYIVEEMAYPWKLVHCKDGFVSDMDFANYQLLTRTRNLGGGTCWGGDLLRSVGWWAPPGIIQGSIDWFWTSLVGDTPLGVYLSGVSVRHDNWRTGRRDKDENDNLSHEYVKRDIAHIGRMVKTDEFAKMRERVLNEYRDYVTGRTG